MAKRTHHRQRNSQSEPHQGVVVVCRGGACGNRLKHPETDHRQQLREFKDALEDTIIVTRCLDACEQSNVVVLSPSDAERESGLEERWIGGVIDAEITREVIDFSSNPMRPLPLLVELQTFRPSRRNRAELDTEVKKAGL